MRNQTEIELNRINITVTQNVLLQCEQHWWHGGKLFVEGGTEYHVLGLGLAEPTCNCRFDGEEHGV